LTFGEACKACPVTPKEVQEYYDARRKTDPTLTGEWGAKGTGELATSKKDEYFSQVS
jgi:hypothetical protein